MGTNGQILDWERSQDYGTGHIAFGRGVVPIVPIFCPICHQRGISWIGEVMSVSVTPFSQPILALPRNCSVRSPLQENRCNISVRDRPCFGESECL